MQDAPEYTFICSKCGIDLFLYRLEGKKFSIDPCICTTAATAPPAKRVINPPKNLLYHVTPLANYRWNIAQLTARWPAFTGKKVIAVARDAEFDDIDTVISLFPKDPNLEFISVSNHPELRETHSLATLLLAASKFDRSGYTFYAHTKGVTRKDDPAVTLWTDAMYHYNLDDMLAVETQLKKFPVTGCCKRRGKFAHFPKASVYHYSGTFFWFRNKALFENSWMNVPQIRYGAEAYISLLFKDAEAGCLWGDRFHNGYDWNYIKTIVQNDPYFADFLAKNINYHSDWGKTRKLRPLPAVG